MASELVDSTETSTHGFLQSLIEAPMNYAKLRGIVKNDCDPALM